MTWNTGTYVSGFAHGVLILWALLGGLFLSANDPLPLKTTEVSLMSGEEFAALTIPEASPDGSFVDPAVPVPDIQENAPAATPDMDSAPEASLPVEVDQPEPETTPDQPRLDPVPQADVLEDAPIAPLPPAPDTASQITPSSDATPKPAPAPRIAPISAPEPAPDAEIAETVTPEVVPDEVAQTPAEEKPATAPQQAASEIVTEAEEPAAAPLASSRPKRRPKPPTNVAQTPSSEEPQADAIADAVAAAVAQEPAVPSGPPLSRGEKDSLRVAVSSCWNVGSLSSEALQTTVVVGVTMSRAGKPDTGSIRLLSFDGGSAAAADQAYEAARRAVIRCGANGYNLPTEKYSQWQNIEMTFNPKDMRIK